MIGYQLNLTNKSVAVSRPCLGVCKALGFIVISFLLTEITIVGLFVLG